MSFILGVDEVGRGPLAGPLVAAAVLLDSNQTILGVTDSKLLTHAKRIELVPLIKQQAIAVGLGWVAPEEIDNNGLTWANRQAMLRALDGIECQDTEIIIDGKFNYLNDAYECRSIVKADQLYPCVSAASIVAKVARDCYMHQMSKLYPNYGFESHVGYGTRHHQQQIRTFGASPLHRGLFLTNILSSVD